MNREKLDFFYKHPHLAQLLLSLGLGFVGAIVFMVTKDTTNNQWIIIQLLIFALILTVSFAYPLMITGYQVMLLVKHIRNKEQVKQKIAFDIWSLFLALCFEFLYLKAIKQVSFDADWHVQLYNFQVHTPLYTGSYISMILLFVLSALALFLLWKKSANQRPPLITVLCFSMLYLGMILTIVWTVHIFKFKQIQDLSLLLPSIVIVSVVLKAMIVQVREFSPDPSRRSKIDRIPVLSYLNTMLMNAKTWPIMAFLLMLPLLAIIVLILILFGQAPNSLIKAFTETSQWNLSQKVSPQNIMRDEHYLCTVAAGGHKKIVKPLRKGIRHGHSVTVNRQLLIANAFEQLLEERIPKIHRAVRNFYDRFGFPLARIIKSQWIADILWILMKPLEWIFLIILYLCDARPEDRIAIQYTGKQHSDFY